MLQKLRFFNAKHKHILPNLKTDSGTQNATVPEPHASAPSTAMFLNKTTKNSLNINDIEIPTDSNFINEENFLIEIRNKILNDIELFLHDITLDIDTAKKE